MVLWQSKLGMMVFSQNQMTRHCPYHAPWGFKHCGLGHTDPSSLLAAGPPPAGPSSDSHGLGGIAVRSRG